MQFAIGEIIVFLVISAILGGLIGLVLCRARSRRQVEQRVDHSHRTHAAELGQIRARLDDRNVEIVGLNDQLAETQGRMRALEAEIESRMAAGPDFEEQLGELRRQLDAAAARAGAAESGMEAATTDAGDARRDLAAAEVKAAAAAAELEAHHRGSEALEETLADRDRKVEGLETELADLHRSGNRTTTEDGGDREVAGADGDGGALQDETLPDAFPSQLAIDVPPESLRVEDARTRVAGIASRTRGDGPAMDDDLTRIRGIGPKISAMLADLDITSFRQIANFTDADVDVVSTALESFPDRIRRDDWMTSARMLHEAKYGESLA